LIHERKGYSNRDDISICSCGRERPSVRCKATR
jgi:hypothetical protein